MITAVLVFAVVIIALCLWGITAPRPMINRVAGLWHKPWGLPAAVGIRLGLGMLFLQAAPLTRYPGIFELLGYVMIFAAIVIALMGRKLIDRFITYWIAQPGAWIRAWLVVGVVFGVFVIYSVTGA